MARDRRPRGNKHEKRPVIDTGTVVARGGSGSVIMRGPVRGTVRRSSRGGVRFLVFVGFLFALYWLVGSFRMEIVERIPAAYPVLKALGYEVEQPAGFGLRAEVVRWDRDRDQDQAAYLLINGVITNTRGERVSIPRLRLVISSSRHPDMVFVADPPQPSLGPRDRTRFEVRHRTGVTLINPVVRVSFEKK
jgi:hypothetical protein